MVILWLVPLLITPFVVFSGMRSYAKRAAMTVGHRGIVAISSLFLAAVLFVDCNSYAMVANVGPCLTLLGCFLLPLGEGVAVAARFLEFLLIFPLTGFAIAVVLRPRRRIVERPLSTERPAQRV
jgi:hypothetical protein